MVRKRLEVQEDLQSRVQIFRVLAFIALALIIGRLWFMQIIMGSEFNNMAQNNRIRERSIEAIRGTIYDRNKKTILSSKPALTISVIPNIFNKNKDVQQRLSKLIGVPLSEIKERMKDKRTDPLHRKVIERSVNQEVVFYIKERPTDFKGVRVEIKPERHYVHGNLAAHLLGYVGEVSEDELNKRHFKDVDQGDLVGKTGLENYYNSMLMGLKGQELHETNAAGRAVRIIKRKAAIGGSSIMTTIDLNIQKYAEAGLRDAMKIAKTQTDKHGGGKYLGTGGAVVVMDPRNGDILAQASYPTFNPGVFTGGVSQKEWKHLTSKKNNYPMNNRATTSVYPPGSTFKPFVAIAGLESGLVTRSTTINSTGSYKPSPKWPRAFNDWKKGGHGLTDLHKSIVESVDTYYYDIGYKAYKSKKEHIQIWAKKFGFDKETGITLPHEQSGRVPTKRWKIWFNRGSGKEQYRIWYPGDTINISIGQGDLLVSPIQMANAVSALANGGYLYKPRLVKAMLSPDGNIKRRFGKKLTHKIKVNPSYLQAVREGMRDVTKGSGTASGAFGGFPVDVAGKTGTSQVKGKQTTAWFVSYAPAKNPRYVVVMVVEQGGQGGSTAAPAVKNIYANIFKKIVAKSKKKNEKESENKVQKEVPTD